MAQHAEPAKEPTGRPRVVLADADPHSRQYVTQLLAHHYDVRAADASSALAQAVAWNPDVIVANVTVRPTVDCDLLRRSRRDAWDTTPVIWYAMRGDEQSSATSSEDGDDYDVTILPSSEHQLLALVRAHSRVTRMRDESMQALRLSEERFRTLTTTMTPGVWVAGPDGKVIGELAWWWHRRTGQAPGQGAGVGWLDVVHPDDKPRVLERVQHALKTKSAYDVEFRIRGRDGTYAYVRSQGAPVRDGHGDVREWIGTLVDVDEQRRTEAALRVSEERYRTFMNMTALVIWTTAPNGGVVTEMHGWAELTGQTADQSRGFGWLDALHPDDRPRMLDDWRYALSHGTPVDAVYRVKRRDGTYGYVRDQGVPLQNPDGSVREWIGWVIDIDHEKRVEEALRASEERYRTLATSTTTGIWQATPAGEIVGECRGWELITGQTPEQYRGWGWADVLHPEDKERSLTVWQHALRHAIPVDVTYRSRRRDGSYGYVRAQGAPVVNADGSVREWIGTISDIDDQKRAEEALRASEEELRANFEMAGIGQVQTDPKTGRYIRVNDRFCEMVGYTRAELLAMTFLDLTHPEDRAAAMALLLDWLRDETSGSTTDQRDTRYVRKDGSVLWGLVTSTLIQDAHGRPLRTIAMIEEVTERRQSEALALCQKKALEMVAQGAALNEVLDFVIVAVEKQAIVTLRGAIYLLDEKGTQLRLCAAPSLPESCRRTLALAPADCQQAPRVRAVSLGRQTIVEDLATAPEGADIAKALMPYGIRSIWAAPILSSNHTPLGSFCLYGSTPGTPSAIQKTLMDNVAETVALAIERKQAEAERERMLIREQAAREMAEAANRVKDEFLAIVSHELRTPLSAINGWAYMLLRGGLDGPAQIRAIQSIQRQVRAQTTLINDLLDVARIASGKVKLELREVDPARVINAAVDVVRPTAEAKRIELVAELSPVVTTVSADSERLQQVIWNLLTNAIRFTPAGGRVTIRSRRTDSVIEIAVADTGEGIGEDFLPYVFDRFRQAEGSTTRRHGGLGLGLAIVRQLTELHGGTVSAASPGKGKGATFTIWLPVSVHADQNERSRVEDRKPVPETLEDVGAQPRQILKDVRVLVVEDRQEDREILSAALAHQGATVDTAGSAAEALTELHHFRPDVLVADIGMPGEDGYDLIRKIRASSPEHERRTPAIALTAYAGDADQKRALEAGYQKHITKPADPNELARTIFDLAHQSR
jgi:PAS domain S-box-containing protein